MLGRLVDTVIKCMPVKPCRVTMIGDSECTISALDSPTASLAAYFANRLIEVEDNIKKWGAGTDTDEMKETEEEILSVLVRMSWLILFSTHLER